ncbi:MAG: hypothetical protein K0R38_373 [Polyangiaceae bacterium]|nr:hypothetical protein [Polyangiaceae bacterium]
MSHMARKSPPPHDLVPPRDDEASTVRSRDGEAGTRPRQESSSELKASASPRRSHSSTRPAQGSLDDRLAKKMQVAGELMKDLPPTDARVRLLYVAIMRRDEALLDGLLAELNKVPPSR